MYLVTAEMSDWDAHDLRIIGLFSNQELVQPAIRKWVAYMFDKWGKDFPYNKKYFEWNNILQALTLGPSDYHIYGVNVKKIEVNKVIDGAMV